jgi:hypothetical protein
MVWRKSVAWLEGLALQVLFWWREEGGGRRGKGYICNLIFKVVSYRLGEVSRNFLFSFFLWDSD